MNALLPNHLEALRLRMTGRMAALLESQTRTKLFAGHLHDLVRRTLAEALSELVDIARATQGCDIQTRVQALRETCTRLFDALNLLIDERRNQWQRQDAHIGRATLEFNEALSTLASTLIEKDLLERQSRVLERIILSHENVAHWREFVQDILLDFHSIFPFDLFYIAFAEEDGLSLFIYYLGAYEEQVRTEARQLLSKKMLASLGLGDDALLNIEEFIVDGGGTPRGLAEVRMITVAVPEHQPKLAGLLGVAYVASGDMSAQEESVVRSILSVMVMVVGSSKMLSRTMAELEYYALHDPLTGLYNRRYFNDVLGYEIGRSERHHHEFALLLLDLDNFKDINDAYGHQTGDEALRSIAEVLRNHVRKGDIAARIGGDEFTVLLMETGRVGASSVAAMLGQALRELPFRSTDGKTFHLTASIGIAVFPTDAQNEIDMLAGADVAMYRAKELGKDNAYTFESLVDRVADGRSARDYAEKIRVALQEQRIIPYFHRIVDCRSGKLVACETLARMIDPNGSVIPAGSFIDTVEKYGMARDLDRSIIARAFQSKRAQMAVGDAGMKVFLNLSAQEIQSRGVLAYAEGLCNEFNIPPSCVVFEILERDAIGDMTNMRKFLANLREKGFEFALDDFGSGYNSFHYLRELRFEYVKIDGTFVRSILHSKIDYALVKNLSNLCRDLGIKTVAEFVESDEIFQAVKDIGVDYAQGFYIGNPSREMPTGTP